MRKHLCAWKSGMEESSPTRRSLSKELNCEHFQMKKAVTANVYIFKSIRCSDGALHIKYNKKTLTETIYTRIGFVPSHNNYCFLILWAPPKFVSLHQAIFKYTTLPLRFIPWLWAYASQFYLRPGLLARAAFLHALGNYSHVQRVSKASIPLIKIISLREKNVDCLEGKESNHTVK